MTLFHNTIGANESNLVSHNSNCKTQEDKILAIFKMKGSGWHLTPFDVLRDYSKLYPPVPITSIRRAISNLTEQNKLIKTSFMLKEEYGKPNFTWMYNFSYGK